MVQIEIDVNYILWMEEFLLACMWRSAYFTRSSLESTKTCWWRGGDTFLVVSGVFMSWWRYLLLFQKHTAYWNTRCECAQGSGLVCLESRLEQFWYIHCTQLSCLGASQSDIVMVSIGLKLFCRKFHTTHVRWAAGGFEDVEFSKVKFEWRSNVSDVLWSGRLPRS